MITNPQLPTAAALDAIIAQGPNANALGLVALTAALKGLRDGILYGDTKTPGTINAIVNKTANFTLATTEAGNFITVDSAVSTNINCTIPTGMVPSDAGAVEVRICRAGVGTVTFVAGAGMTLKGPATIPATNSVAKLIITANTVYVDLGSGTQTNLVSFYETIPDNEDDGKDTDIAMMASGDIYQKAAGIWVKKVALKRGSVIYATDNTEVTTAFVRPGLYRHNGTAYEFRRDLTPDVEWADITGTPPINLTIGADHLYKSVSVYVAGTVNITVPQNLFTGSGAMAPFEIFIGEALTVLNFTAGGTSKFRVGSTGTEVTTLNVAAGNKYKILRFLTTGGIHRIN